MPAGVTTVICVLLTTDTDVAGFAPNLTVLPVEKPLPLIVTGVPPDAGPLGGTMEPMIG